MAPLVPTSPRPDAGLPSKILAALTHLNDAGIARNLNTHEIIISPMESARLEARKDRDHTDIFASDLQEL